MHLNRTHLNRTHMIHTHLNRTHLLVPVAELVSAQSAFMFLHEGHLSITR